LHLRIFLAALATAGVGIVTLALRGSVIEAFLLTSLAALPAALLLTRSFQRDARDSLARAVDLSTQQMMRRLQELDTDRARTAAMLAGMVEGVLVVDADGRLRLVNQAARRMLHLEDIPLGRHYLEAVRQPGVGQQLGSALRGEQPPPIEVALDLGTPASGPGIFRAQATPTSPGDGGGAVLVLYEITDLRRADRVRRDFVANVSHELRTPLTAVRGYVEALMEEPSPLDAARRAQFLEVIARHTLRMERLVRDLLRLARLDAQQEVVERHSIDLGALLRAVVSDCGETIERQRLTVEVNVDPGTATIEADLTKLHDTLRNLIENAVNYSPESGRIVLSARPDDNQVVLSVADQGPGLPDADLERVFERFYRVEKSRARDPGGTGLGLSIVRHLVELHGGRVQAANRPEGGAIFTIRLPLKDN
jgi:two-component system phosphate regulon sensor histidine kinase PhoR